LRVEPTLTACEEALFQWELLPEDHPLQACPLASNLVYRAFQVYHQANRLPVGQTFRFTLTKRIPLQAGLGGGSSNAAIALVLLQQWCQEQELPTLSDFEMMSLAQSLGADVPFFLSSAMAAWGRAKGDVLTEDRAFIPTAFTGGGWLLVKPKALGVETAWAYQQLAWGNHYTQRVAPESEAFRVPENLPTALFNSFQAPLLAQLPELQAVAEGLSKHGAAGVLLCGSGATMAGYFPENPCQASCWESVFPAQQYWKQWASFATS
jgi:4-diphosphocytidyl-2-C-methyl-D-erythritol kinase